MYQEAALKKMVSLIANVIRKRKVEYIKLRSDLIPENLCENGQLARLSSDDIRLTISKLPDELKG